MDWDFEKEIIKNLLGKKIEKLFGTYLQVFRKKDNKCFNELNKITLKIEGVFYSIQSSFEKSNPIYEGATRPDFTYDYGNYGLWNEKIIEFSYLDDWGNIFSGIGFVFNKKTEKKEGFFIEINGYKKIFFIIKKELKIPAYSLLDGWEFVIETSIPNDFFSKKITIE